MAIKSPPSLTNGLSPITGPSLYWPLICHAFAVLGSVPA